jgi:hypothetical protein
MIARTKKNICALFLTLTLHLVSCKHFVSP